MEVNVKGNDKNNVLKDKMKCRILIQEGYGDGKNVTIPKKIFDIKTVLPQLLI